jgi:hypothetical protein
VCLFTVTVISLHSGKKACKDFQKKLHQNTAKTSLINLKKLYKLLLLTKEDGQIFKIKFQIVIIFSFFYHFILNFSTILNK